MHAFRSHNKVTPNLVASVSIYHCHSLCELGDQEQPSWEVQAHEVTMEMLAVVIEDGPEAGGAISKESYLCTATLELGIYPWIG